MWIVGNVGNEVEFKDEMLHNDFDLIIHDKLWKLKGKKAFGCTVWALKNLASGKSKKLEFKRNEMI